MGSFERHTACPCGKSSDAFAIYKRQDSDTETFNCFSCNNDDIPKPFFAAHKKKKEKDVEGTIQLFLDKETNVINTPTTKTVPKSNTLWSKGLYAAIDERKITKDTVKKYGVRLYKHEDGSYSHLYPFYSSRGKLLSYKERQTPKTFRTAGDFKQSVLFGMNVFEAGQKYLTITEGELDALAAYQLLGGAGPVVSLKNGVSSVASSLKTKAIYEYVNSFETIVLCFDNDEEGQKASEEFAKMFDYNKVKIMKLQNGYKDACDYLKESKHKDFVNAFWKAEKYSPSDIIDMSSPDFRQKVFFSEKSDIVCYDYPYKTLNEMTFGARMAEMVVIWADTKVGKSQLLKEFEYHFRKTTDFPIGLLHFEEQDTFTAKALTSLELDCPIYLPSHKDDFTTKEQAEAYDRISKGFHLYGQFGSKGIQEVIDTVQYLVKAVGCKFIFLDHINMIVSDQRHDDERKALDEIATKLKTKTLEWDFNLHIVAHNNRQDKIRGTGNIDKLANIVIKMERDKLEPDARKRNTSKLIVTENRFAPFSGPAGYLFYEDTGRLVEVDNSDEFEVRA